MTINNEEQFHGAAFLRLLESLSERAPEIRISVENLHSRNLYKVIAEKPKLLGKSKYVMFGVVIKLSTKRRSPWRYSYTQQNQDDLKNLYDEFGETFSVFANGEDGFACLTFSELKEVLDEIHEESEWVSVARKLRHEYRIAGNDGRRERTLPRNSFPKTIVDFILSRLG